MHTMVILHPDDQQLRVKHKKQKNEFNSLLRNLEINHYNDDLELHKICIIFYLEHKLLQTSVLNLEFTNDKCQGHCYININSKNH